MWQHLIETALLGTDKKALSPEVFPDEINAINSGVSHDSETSYLNMLSAGYFYLEAGKLPAKLISEPDTTIIEETQPFTSGQLAMVFDLIENLPLKLKEPLLNNWLDVVISNNEILPVATAIKLAIAGNSYVETTKSKIPRVIGKRVGKTLAYHSTLRYGESIKEAFSWSEGNLSERKALLSNLLTTNQAQAVELLQSTWAQEPIVNKRAFLDMIRTCKVQSGATIAFSQALYDNEFAFQPKEKKTEKECRRILAEILVQSDDSPLHHQTLLTLEGYLTVQKKKGFMGLLMSKQQMSFQLPPEEDGFWNGNNMERTFGFEPKNYDIDAFQTLTQSWLAGILEFIPMPIWVSQHFGTYAVLMTCFLDDEQFHIKRDGKSISIFRDSLVQNAIDYGDKLLALELLPRVSAEKALPLLRMVDASDFEAYIKNNNLFDDEKALEAGPYAQTDHWSAAFSEYVLKSILHKAVNNQYMNLSSLGVVLARFVHPSVQPILERLTAQASNSALSHHWQTHIHQNITTTIDIKTRIKQNNHNQ